MKPRNFPRLRGFFFSVAESQMPFQVVELRLDAEDQVIDRRAIPYPYPQRTETDASHWEWHILATIWHGILWPK